MSTAPFDALVTPSANGTEPVALITTDPAERPRRGRRLLRLAALAGLALVVAVAAFLYDPRKLWEDEPAAAPAARDTAIASTTSLAASYEAEGSVVYREPLEITAAGPGGVVTDVVEAEDTVQRGEVLWRVVDEPVVALFGDVPASRRLTEGTEGPDVRQLEENLVALGYDTGGDLTVDEEYTSYTEVVVERWQEDIGADVTGAVEDGAIVFLPGVGRVGQTTIDVGDTLLSGGVVMTITEPTRVVEFTVPASDRETIAIGDIVSARLPDRSSVAATVSAILFRGDGGIDVWADLEDPIDSAVDTVPVTITWDVPIGEDVLTVPAESLIRTDDGAYNVEIRRSTGVEELVPVDVGRTSGVTVEVIGDIADGDEVIAP